MGFDIGACGAYGILIDPEVLAADDYDGPLKALRSRISLAVIDAREAHEECCHSLEDCIDAEFEPILNDIFEAYRGVGINVPPGATMHWTGNDEDRVGRCGTDPACLVLGFGIYDFFSEPTARSINQFSASFRGASQLWTWHWGG